MTLPGTRVLRVYPSKLIVVGKELIFHGIHVHLMSFLGIEISTGLYDPACLHSIVCPEWDATPFNATTISNNLDGTKLFKRTRMSMGLWVAAEHDNLNNMSM